MNKIDVLEDVAIITSLSKLSLQNLSEKFIDVISHGVFEGVQECEPQCSFDIGIGTLYIKLEESSVKYKFIPSKTLEETIAFTVKERQSPLIIDADKALGQRIENAYRCLL